MERQKNLFVIKSLLRAVRHTQLYSKYGNCIALVSNWKTLIFTAKLQQVNHVPLGIQEHGKSTIIPPEVLQGVGLLKKNGTSS